MKREQIGEDGLYFLSYTEIPGREFEYSKVVCLLNQTLNLLILTKVSLSTTIV